MSNPSLKERLTRKGALLAPGVYDALSALLAKQAGYRQSNQLRFHR